MSTSAPTNAVATESRDRAVLVAKARNDTLAATVTDGPHDPFELLGAEAQIASVVGAGRPEHDQPAERQ